MAGGFGPRFAIEAGFLILLAAAAGVADLRPLVIVAIVGGGWLLVSLLELALWRAETRPAPVEYAAAQGEPTGEVEAELEVEEEAPAEEPELGEDVEEDEDGYPLRAGAGEEPSEEQEAYTTVLREDEAAEREAAAAERGE